MPDPVKLLMLVGAATPPGRLAAAIAFAAGAAQDAAVDILNLALAPTAVYLTGGDFRDGQLQSEAAQGDIAALTRTLVALARLDPAALGPPPLAAKFT